MAVGKSKTLEDFIRNFPRWPDVILAKAVDIFNNRTEFAVGQSIYVAPHDTGALRNRANIDVMKAKVSPNGIKSSYSFKARAKDGFNYPSYVNNGISKSGKELNIKKRFNRFAQSHFAEKGLEKTEPSLALSILELAEREFIKL